VTGGVSAVGAGAVGAGAVGAGAVGAGAVGAGAVGAGAVGAGAVGAGGGAERGVAVVSGTAGVRGAAGTSRKPLGVPSDGLEPDALPAAAGASGSFVDAAGTGASAGCVLG
jgi:hypothetical protein